MKKYIDGFTMIELLMTIMIIAILGAAALPQFLDFRNEAKAAAVQQILATMRAGIKNQIQQSLLKCGNSGDPKVPGTAGWNTYLLRLGVSIYYNDITSYENNSQYRICTQAQIPNIADRYFWNRISDNQRARNFLFGTDLGFNGSYFDKNPFLVPDPNADTRTLYIIDQIILQTFGDSTVCDFIDSSLAAGIHGHWIYNFDTGEIHAGTNTPGIRECSF